MRREYDDEEDGDTILADDLSMCDEEGNGSGVWAKFAPMDSRVAGCWMIQGEPHTIAPNFTPLREPKQHHLV